MGAGNPVSTQGTDRKVLSATLQAAGAGESQTVIPGKDGVSYRVVGCQTSLASNGTCFVYHGDAYSADKVISGGYIAANTGKNVEDSDWALCGAPGTPVSADVTGGAAIIVVKYVEIQNTPGTF